MSDSLSRRHVIIGVAAVSAATIGGGAILFATADAKAALLEFFRRALPSVAIGTQSANACIDSFMTRRSTMKRHALNTAWQTAGVELMAGLNENFKSASRMALTQFLVNSNFFEVTDPRAELIVYVSKPPSAACASPFANLDPP